MEEANSFLDILEKEISLYQELVGLLEKSRPGLLRMSLNDIISGKNEQEKLLEQISDIENSFDIAVDKLAERLGADKSNIKRSFLITVFDAPLSERLNSLSDSFANVFKKFETSKILYLDIINAALSHIDDSLYILGGGTCNMSGYGASGKSVCQSDPGLLSSKL